MCGRICEYVDRCAAVGVSMGSSVGGQVGGCTSRWVKSRVRDRLGMGRFKGTSVPFIPLPSTSCFQIHHLSSCDRAHRVAIPLCNPQSFHPSRSPTNQLWHGSNKHPLRKPVTQKDALEPDPELGKGRAPSASALAGPVGGSHRVKLLLWRLK